MSYRLLYIVLFLLPVTGWGQAPDSASTPVLERKSIIMQGSVSNTNSAAVKLTESLENQLPDAQIADDYLTLAEQLSAAGDLARAEEYLTRALNLYIKEGEAQKTALTHRELAKIYERSGEYDKAIASFEEAARITRLGPFRQINQNDAGRLRNMDDPAKQGKFIAGNIDILSQAEATGGFSEVKVEEEMADAYIQMANTQSRPEEKELFMNMAVGKSQTGRSGVILSEAQPRHPSFDSLGVKAFGTVGQNSLPLAANSVPAGSAAEFSASEPASLESLEAAYATLVARNNPYEVRTIVDRLVGMYLDAGMNERALEIYSDYTSKLEEAIRRDSLLSQHDMFLLMEDKILRLEKDRVMQNELIRRQNRFNYVLLGSVFLAVVFLVLIARALRAIKRKNKRIALQSLRREMNPHFLFNSLNSVNQFIAQNDELSANKYLTSYSKLMRNIMENSNSDFITLEVELEQLTEYLELEHLRFRDKFDYRIEVDESLRTENIYVPNMIVQPQLENAIWHGLRYGTQKGLLTLGFGLAADGRICVRVEDNGIGLTRSRELKTHHQKAHKSRGMSNTRERISLLNDLYAAAIEMEVKEKQGPETGVLVSICFPRIEEKMVERK